MDHLLPPALLERLAVDDDLGARALLAQNHPDAHAPLLLRSFLEYTGPERSHLTTRPNLPPTDWPPSPTTRTPRSGPWQNATPKLSRQLWSGSHGTRTLP